MIKLYTPLAEGDVEKLEIGDMVLISGGVFCGRDAVLPRICDLYRENELGEIDLKGGLIFHTAVSVAGVGPTSSNKVEIENSMGILSEAGIKVHLGKGKISKKTIEVLDRNNSVYAVVPPVTALLTNNIISSKVAAYPELGMEAFYELEVKDYPMIIAAAHGKSIYD